MVCVLARDRAGRGHVVDRRAAVSGIYIPGMDMPGRDEVITIFPDGTAHRHHLPLGLNISKSKAIPVPDHGRLGDLDALMENIGNAEYKGAVKRVLIQAPTIIPASEEVYDRYTDTAGNIHWTGTESGHHVIPADPADKEGTE